MSYKYCYRRILRSAVLFLISTLLFSYPFNTFIYAQVSLDGSMGTGGSLTGPDYNITSELGQIRGSNLFHSFGEFNVNTGESATFS
ncbi:MAG: filamentous hemagglutinin N-terminal domain-containing protein [Candidatus Scalindua sp.]|nr:filamentous hemagglutinin N-terminal domain-containing protein [Candidatus Scalindua sp.]